MRDSLGRRVWATALTGIPFAIFKLGAGVYLHETYPAVGVALMVWCTLDIVLNLLSLVLPDHVSYCTLSNIGRQIDRRRGGKRWEPVLLALDTLLAFAIISLMIWFRLLPHLPPLLGRVWDLAVVANIVAVGLERLWRAWTKREDPQGIAPSPAP